MVNLTPPPPPRHYYFTPLLLGLNNINYQFHERAPVHLQTHCEHTHLPSHGHSGS